VVCFRGVQTGGAPMYTNSWGMKLFGALACVVAGWMASAAAVAGAPAHPAYHLLRTIHLPGTEGWDYLSIDSTARRLYIGRGQYLQVLDIDSGRLIASITGIRGVHGIVLVPSLHRGFTVDSDSSTILDLASLKALSSLKAGKDPDGYAYDPATNRVFIMNSAGDDATAIDAARGTVVGTIPFGGQPEFTVSDGHGEMFVNITDQNELLAFDARTLQVLHRWPMRGCEGPSGLSMDRAHRRLFAACDNETMVVMDADNGRVVAALPTGAGTDASLFDPATENAFASAGGCGTLTVIHEDSPEHFRAIDNVRTASGARTMALDEKTHDVLLVTARHGHGATYTQVLPGSFVVLVVGRGVGG
jgi:DNA-binding beta-propeller fold protein YncE